MEKDSTLVSPVPRYKQTRAWDRLRHSWVGELVRGYRGCKREVMAWLDCPQVALPDPEQLAKSFAIFESQAARHKAEEPDIEAPIILLSTGMRAGSTLLQRILLTDSRLLLWGEPLGEMTIVSRFADMIGQSISARNLEKWREQPDPSSPGLSTTWVANLYPPGDDFRLAVRGLFQRWLGVPARERGFARWGFKEVRLGAPEAILLHWLYPGAKFLIITRNPFDAYRSLADAAWGQVFYRYPDVPGDSAAFFARHWNRLALGWTQLPSGFPSVHLKYEDLIAGKVDFRRLESWLGLQLKESVALSAAVGGTAKRSQLTWYERWIISREAAPGMRALGYSKSS